MCAADCGRRAPRAPDLLTEFFCLTCLLGECWTCFCQWFSTWFPSLPSASRPPRCPMLHLSCLFAIVLPSLSRFLSAGIWRRIQVFVILLSPSPHPLDQKLCKALTFFGVLCLGYDMGCQQPAVRRLQSGLQPIPRLRYLFENPQCLFQALVAQILNQVCTCISEKLLTRCVWAGCEWCRSSRIWRWGVWWWWCKRWSDIEHSD